MQGAFVVLSCLWHQFSLLSYKAFAMIIFLSLKCFAVFFFMELLIGCFITFLLDIREGGQMRLSMYAMEGHSKCTCVYDEGRGGQILAILVHTY